VCGDTLFSLARQGREFLPGKFTDIDRMRASGGGRRSAIGCRMSANKCREMTGDDLSATFRTATLNVALGRKQKFKLRHYRQSRALAGKMRVLKRVNARAGFLPGFFMLIWPMNSAAFAAARVRAI
jgi:hypothetical protein